MFRVYGRLRSSRVERGEQRTRPRGRRRGWKPASLMFLSLLLRLRADKNTPAAAAGSEMFTAPENKKKSSFHLDDQRRLCVTAETGSSGSESRTSSVAFIMLLTDPRDTYRRSRSLVRCSN